LVIDALAVIAVLTAFATVEMRRRARPAASR